MINDSIVNYKLYIINLIMINSVFNKKIPKYLLQEDLQISTPLGRGQYMMPTFSEHPRYMNYNIQ